VFGLFAILTLIFGIIVYKKVPETNGKTIEEIVDEIQ
jgi:H+/Cl- antiporter ClcA